MNRLWVRLSLAFIGVTLLTVFVIALVASVNVDHEFHRYLEHRQAMEAGHGAMRGRGMMQPADQVFLNHLRETLIISGIVAGGAGIALGILISRTIAAPLSHLSSAARDFAAHRWNRRVTVTGAAEIAEVAQAFNMMADELQQAETLRRNLMADIAHELRTPLTVMQGNLRAMLDGVYPLEMKEVASLYDETRVLSRLVGDLRELALAEAGQLPLKLQPVEVHELLPAITAQFEMVAQTQETHFQLTCSQSLPPVIADKDRLTQVLHNLLTNALRHTHQGVITLYAVVTEKSMRIMVEDTGEGIAPQEVPHVFDRFYKANSSRGTGLGLAIAKAWVEAMGGEIGVESVMGKGSTFWFTLRLAPAVG
jgi:two-component system, OmpR family, sensor kinase